MNAVLETRRLRLREFTLADAPVLLELLNDSGFLNNVGDRGVRTIADAENYIREKFLRSYRDDGFGLYLTEIRETREPIGMCGLVQRDYLDVPDLGFSVLERFTRRGYTFEAASAVMQWAQRTLGLQRVVAVTLRTNAAAHRLLEKLGMRVEGAVQVPADAREWVLFAP